MSKENFVQEPQLLPEPRKRRWWKTKGPKAIKLLSFVLKLLGMVLKLLKIFGSIAKEMHKLIEQFWPG